jgi:protein-S-isoprenylcysteine O-methyltransferase Ste14
MTTTSVTVSARERWRRSRAVVIIAALVVAAGIVLAVAQGQYGRGFLDPTSTQPSGSRALARLLDAAGVTVHDLDRDAEARSLADARGGAATILVTEPDLLDADRLGALVDTGADVVLVAATSAVDHLDADLVAADIGTEVVAPECDLPAAQRAEQARAGGVGYRLAGASDDAVLCYPVDDASALAVVTAPTGSTVTLLGSTDVLTNRRLDEDGNAALAMNLLGSHPDLVWFQPRVAATGDTPAAALLPDWVRPVLGLLAVAAVLAAVWRGRRLGRLVVEPLPVAVRASETAEGRGRLYRHGRDRAHSAAVLREASIDRLRARLGLPGAAPVGDVAAVVAARLGRPGAEVTTILAGPPPDDDGALVGLAHDLDTLEAQTHRLR